MAVYDKYENKANYWLDYYEEKLKFAYDSVNMQLKKAADRKKDIQFEWKLYVFVLLAMIVLIPVSVLFCLSQAFVLTIIGATVLVIMSFSVVFVYPICIYKIVRGTVFHIINDMENSLGDWMVNKYHLTRVSGEIIACQTHMNRYKLLLDEIEMMREELGKGSLDVTEQKIKSRFEDVNYTPKIDVANSDYGRTKRFVGKVSLVIAIVVYIILLMIGLKIGIAAMSSLQALFEQL